jgi:RNA-directed DNA polymerase
MKESDVEGVANHDGPESCAGSREGAGEALTGVRAGWVLSRETPVFRGADALTRCGRQHSAQRYRELRRGPARSETPMHARNLQAREPGDPLFA